jgi:hypothetical protein
MDSIFDEDVDEVGGEIEAYCPSPRCKADTTHTIISMYEDEVRRVQCVVCGDVHAYRKPRGDSVEETAVGAVEPRRTSSSKPSWEQAMSRVSDADIMNCRPYSIRDIYEEGDLVHHSTFDIGVVTELMADNKVEILFKEATKILVHNRGDLAQRMPGISEMPPPREAKKKKRVKKKDEAPPVERRSAKDLAEALDLARRAAQAKLDGTSGKPLAPPPKGKQAAKEAPKGDSKAKAPAKEPPKTAKGKEPAKKPAPPPPKKAAAAKKAPEKKPAAKKPAPPPKKAAAKKPVAKKPAAKPAKKPAAKPAKKPAAKKPAKKKK